MPRLIIGLGNPGAQYAETRHNAGFWAVERLAAKQGGSFSEWQGHLLASFGAGEEKTYVLKPQSYMNRSGEAVQKAASYFKIAPENCLVISDDVYLLPGKAKVSSKGDGGHNGLASITAHLGQVARLRLGVGVYPQAPEERATAPELSDYVLQKLPQNEREIVDKLFDFLLPNLIDFCNTGQISAGTYSLPPANKTT